VAVSLLEVFQHYRFRPLRAGMYVSLGLWGVVPAVHVWHELGSVPEVMKALKLDVLMGILYVVRLCSGESRYVMCM
jgi:predicted membrane channel-forming protein YqfA (hemolysin III family)